MTLTYFTAAAGSGAVQITMEGAAQAATMGIRTLFVSFEMANATRMPWDDARDLWLKRRAGRVGYWGFLEGMKQRSRRRCWRQ